MDRRAYHTQTSTARGSPTRFSSLYLYSALPNARRAHRFAAIRAVFGGHAQQGNEMLFIAAQACDGGPDILRL